MDKKGQIILLKPPCVFRVTSQKEEEEGKTLKLSKIFVPTNKYSNIEIQTKKDVRIKTKARDFMVRKNTN